MLGGPQACDSQAPIQAFSKAKQAPPLLRHACPSAREVEASSGKGEVGRQTHSSGEERTAQTREQAEIRSDLG